MSTQKQAGGCTPLLEEIIDNAADLPLDSQEWILTLAKGMAFTREQLLQEQSRT